MRNALNQTVQRIGASRFALRQIERQRRLAPIADLCVMRSYGYVGLLLVLMLIGAGVMFLDFSARSIGVSVGVHSYQRQGDGVYASLVLTNTGAVSVAVPLRFGCQVETASGFTNYIVETPYSVFLQPSQHAVLTNALWQVRLPADTSAWKVNVRIRHMSGRERFVNALRKSELVNSRILSRLAARPRKEADYQWLECGSSLLEVPSTPLSRKNNETGA
jgi:hypothetical protein